MAVDFRPARQGLIFILVIPLLFSPSLAKASPSDLEQVVSSLQATYEGIQDLSARFQQISIHKSSGGKEEGRGSLMMKKPGMMRWEYRSPEPRLIVSDGRVLYMYSPQDRQVIVEEAPQAFSSLAVNFLAGMGKLSEDFRIGWGRSEEKTRKGSLLLELQPMQREGQIQLILMEIHAESFLVERIVLRDAYSNTTILSFKKVKVNTGLPDSLFTFAPPAGVEVIKGFPGMKRQTEN